MNRRVLGGVIALVVVLVVASYLLLRDRGGTEQAAEATGSGRSGAIAATPAPPAKPDGTPSPRGAAPRWSLDVDPQGPLQLEGQVVGPDGKGVGGAEVWLASVPPRSTKSEDDGTFTFDKLVGRTYQLTASSGELVGGPVSYKLTEKSDPVVVRLAEGAAVIVTVVDDAKQPIDGADVRLGDMSHRIVRTDAKGEATLKPVRPGWVAVQATAPGFAPHTGFATIGSAGATGKIAITLRKGFAVSGRVTDEAGKPIAKARITASGGAWGDFDEGYGDKADVTSDDKGQFTLPALAAGPHTVSAVDGEHAPATSAPITIADRPIGDVAIVMKAGGLVTGKVLDAEGKPVPFATVRLAGTGQMMWQVASRQATSDKHGEFELRGLARAKLQARAESDTVASKLVDLDLTSVAAMRDVKLVLDVAGAISGVVVDDKGSPVTEVQVNAFPDIMGGAPTEGLALAGMSSATTDGAGAFTIHGIPDGAYKLWAARSSAASGDWGQHGVTAKTGDKGVRITLAAEGELRGKVVLEGASSPPKLVTVQVGYQPPTPATDGVFTIKDVTPGTYSVTFRGPEFAQLVKHDVKIEPGKPTDLGTVTVVRGRRLAGKVVDATGRPVAGAKVKLAEMLFSMQGNEEQMESFEDMSGVRSAVSDQDGEFLIIGVPTKATSAMADEPNHGRSLAVAIPEGTDDPPPVTLALRGFGSISGKVTQRGQPQPGVMIGESSKGGASQVSFGKTDDAGNFTMPKVPEGTHILQAMQSKMMSMKSTSVTVQVTAGKDTKITIDIPVGQITLAIQVKPLANNKVDAAQVFLFSGLVAPVNAKQLTDSFLQGGAQGMKFWFGEGKPIPEFDELVPGEYSVCTIPITGTFSDPAFQQRLQENMTALKVYCKPVKVTAAPTKQSIVHEVPAMAPLPGTPPS
jgi:protocatechuate 3,4-dioxygenase beta subunit